MAGACAPRARGAERGRMSRAPVMSHELPKRSKEPLRWMTMPMCPMNVSTQAPAPLSETFTLPDAPRSRRGIETLPLPSTLKRSGETRQKSAVTVASTRRSPRKSARSWAVPLTVPSPKT